MTDIQVKKALGLITQGAHVNPKDFSIYLPLSSYRMDSLDIVSTVQAIEIEFNITIPDSALPSFKTGKDILYYLEERI